jgi:hypothetical protein
LKVDVMVEMVAVAGVFLLVTLLATLALRYLLPGWPRRRVSVVAAGILPAIALGFCGYVAIDVAMTPDDQCGVDACAMAMAGVFFIGLIAIAAFAIGMVLAEALQSVLERR